MPVCGATVPERRGVRYCEARWQIRPAGRDRRAVTNVPKKIAILLPNLKFGGAERVAINLANALHEEGIQIDILLMSRQGEFVEQAENRCSIIDLRCSRTYKLPGKLAAYLKANKPDALISSFWKLNLCACLARLFYPSVKLILWEHSPPSRSSNSPTWMYAPSASIAYQASTKVVAVSTGVWKDIDRITVGLRRKTVVIFNPVASPKAHLLLPPRSDQQKRLIWVGRFDVPKNPGLMLQAFALLPSDSGISLTMVGEGHLRSESEAACRKLGLHDRVSFTGFKADPYELLARSDLLVLSSDREGLPSVVIEAMHCGLRVVSTDCGDGIRDILLDGRYGTIVPAGDPAAMAQAIAEELSTPLNIQAQIDGAQRFLPQTTAKQFLAAMTAGPA